MADAAALSALTALSSAIGHAQHIAFSEVVYSDRDWKLYHETKQDVRIEKRRRPYATDITVYSVFPQMWGSTALGFGGLGGQAITNAYTVVLECQGEYAVYFAGRHAYTLTHTPNNTFFADIARRQMREVKNAHEYKPQQ